MSPSPKGTVLPGYQLHMLLVSHLHAGGERVLDAGGQHEPPDCPAEGALSAWHGQGDALCLRNYIYVDKTAQYHSGYLVPGRLLR